MTSIALSVIVPVYNEEQNLSGFMQDAVAFCEKHGCRLIIVNDGSTDKSKDILNGFSGSGIVKIIHHKINRGYGGALKSGIRVATTPYLVTIDGDGQHRLEDVLHLYRHVIENDADLVIGKREGKFSSSLYRRLGKYMIRMFTRLLMPIPITDLNSGFKLYRTDLAQKYINVCPDTMAFSNIIALLFLYDRRLVLEHPVQVLPRRTDQSKVRTHTAFETVLQILNTVLMFNPLRVFLPLSLGCILAGLVWGIPIVMLGRGVSVGAMLAIVTGLLFFVSGLLASQLSAMRMEQLHTKKNSYLD